MATNNNEISDFGIVYKQFKNKPKEAIKHLLKVKQGECINALYRKDIGFVDIVWGNENMGLCHIYKKHGSELKQLGFDVENFIPLVFAFGKISKNEKEAKIFFEGDMFKLIVKTKWNRKDKKFLLSAFDLRPISKKK